MTRALLRAATLLVAFSLYSASSIIQPAAYWLHPDQQYAKAKALEAEQSWLARCPAAPEGVIPTSSLIRDDSGYAFTTFDEGWRIHTSGDPHWQVIRFCAANARHLP